MMKFFTSIVTSCKDIAGKLRSIGGKANGIEFEGRQMMQQFGFISIPKAGERCLFLQFGNVVIAVASDGKDRPAVKEGETALYREKEHYIILKDDGTPLWQGSIPLKVLTERSNRSIGISWLIK